ncbi:MAG: amino acid adenylation domain-containing protein, partial [Gemmatimonadetes bacterium]|nr:amino acid adenylation domain-containing protein [Gemmatimonadota bacterium]
MTLENVQEVLHLTSTQAGMLFHSATDRESGVYVAQIRCELTGALDVDAFKGAWDEVLRRHPALRAAFVWDGVDEPLQVIRQEVDLPWTELDWREVPLAEREARLQSLLDEDRRRGFALDAAPLMRMLLIREAAEVHRLVWTCHHIVADGWSAGVVLEEMLTRYGAIRAGSSLELPPSTGLRDYLTWLKGRSPDSEEGFWRSYLRGFETRTPVPPDRTPAPSAKPRLHRFVQRQWSPLESDSIRQRAREARVTLNTLFQGAWSILLHRYTGEVDVMFGTSVAGRPAEVAGLDEAVGLFINTLPVRVEVEPERRLEDWLADLQESLLGVREHQHAALVDIQGWSEMPAGQPLFDSLVVLENAPTADRGEAGGLAMRDLTIVDASNYPLALLIRPGSQIEYELVYDPALYSDAMATRIVEHFRTLVAGLAGAPDQTVGSIPLMSAEESRQVLEEWNDSGTLDLEVETVLDLITEQARTSPTRKAVVCGSDDMSYEELEQRSGVWARRLVSEGVASDDRVGLLMERGPLQIAGILAIMKAGAAYVPLDPDYPAERLDGMVEDSAARVVLTTAALAGRVAGGTELVVVDQPAADPIADLPDVGGEEGAYVIYTSGSTGRPKGVPISHRNLLHSTQARSAYYEHPPGVFLLLSSVAFDSSVAGIFWTLSTGGTLVVPEPRSEQDMSRLARSIERFGVTHTLCLPSLYEALLAHGERHRLTSLKTVIAAGEPLPPELVRRHRSVLPAAGLFNEYGPTEATVWCTVYNTAEYEGETVVPIGRPIPGARIYLLDDHGRPVPTGVVGEIHVAGEGLASGYLDRPEATARHFVLRTISGEPVSVYRTGDLGRYRFDGNIEFLGRRDRQLKIRGFRVEPGEIERALIRHEAIREAIVLPVPAQAGRPALTAFATIVDGSDRPAPTGGELGEFLRGSLPEHMVPASVRILQELPRLPNGKVDAASTAALPEKSVDTQSVRVAPRTAIERQLAAIWRDVLEVDEIGVHDPFFELGGDSILSIHVTSRANQVGLGLSPNDIFNFPTIAELAARCMTSTSGQEGQASDPSSERERAVPNARAPLFLVHVGIKLAARLRRHLGPDQPIFCFSAHWHRADLDMHATVQQLAAECLAELRTLQSTGPYFIGGYSMGASIALEMAQQLRAEGEAVQMLFLLDPPAMRERFGVGAEPVNRIRFSDALSDGPPRTFVDKVSSHLSAIS